MKCRRFRLPIDSLKKSTTIQQTMKSILPLIVASCLPIWVVVAASVGEPPSPDAQVVEKSPETLVAELCHENFKTRENATREIWKLGTAITPLLEEAATSKDPEQATRARDLLRKIQLHITPDTDPSIITLVERYIAAKSINQKMELLGKLRGKRAWRQMLKLYAAENHSEAREKIDPLMRGIALRAAREQLMKSDPDGAREYLEMGATHAAGLLALAEFHRSHGTLDAERERALKSDAPNAKAWLLAIHRSAGDIANARRAAIAAGETRIADAMAVLSGDPLPWLRSVPGEQPSNAITSVYGGIVVRRWSGDKIRNPELEPLIQAASGNNMQLKESAMRALFLLGEFETAEAIFGKSNSFAAFRHFETLERVAEALEVIGLDSKNPDYNGWVAKQLKDLEDEDIEDQHEPSSYAGDLAVFANFLERRGLHDEAWEAFSAPLAKIAKDDDFLDLLRPLFGSGEPLTGAPFLAKRIAAQWAGDDPIRWDDIIATVFGDEDSTRHWWSWLGELDPNASPSDRFDAMLALHNIGNDVDRLRHKWLELVWKSIEKSEGDDRVNSLRYVFEISTMTGDVRTTLKAWDAMEPGVREKSFWEQMLVFLSAEGRWDDVATVLLKQISILTETQQDAGSNLHAYAAAALRQAGREEEASIHDGWVDKLTLGNPLLAIGAGNAYAFGNDYKRAAEWWARAARFAEPESGEFPTAMKLHADVLLDQGKWLETAAISEVLARTYVSSEFRLESPLAFMRQRLQADMARAFSLLQSDRPRAIAMLEKCHRTFIADGSLADHFFPALRQLGLTNEHDQWFDITWARVMEILEIYPESDNTHNTAAWFASRAMRNLDEGEQHAKTALRLNPDQPAYLDTMAEIHFARGNRKKALEWSHLAVAYSPNDVLIRRQLERFRSGSLPK
jgi:tetratricopeptide (TPR) repeat protein